MKKSRCDEIDQNMKDFINNIYLKNNKEIVRLTEEVRGINERFSSYIADNEQYKKQREEREAPMMELFSGMSFLVKYILGTAILGSAVIGLYVEIRKLWG